MCNRQVFPNLRGETGKTRLIFSISRASSRISSERSAKWGPHTMPPYLNGLFTPVPFPHESGDSLIAVRELQDRRNRPLRTCGMFKCNACSPCIGDRENPHGQRIFSGFRNIGLKLPLYCRLEPTEKWKRPRAKIQRMNAVSTPRKIAVLCKVAIKRLDRRKSSRQACPTKGYRLVLKPLFFKV